MAYKGQSPENPVCVTSAIVLNADKSHILVGARRETPNEDRHLRTISTFTRTTPLHIFNALAGGNLDQWSPDVEEPLEESCALFPIGRGAHGENVNTFVVESVLGKAGLSGALAEGSITGLAKAALRSLTRVEDKDTQRPEWTAMLHYQVVLDSSSDLSLIPDRSPSYDPIVWVPANKVPQAYALGDAGILENPKLDTLFLCLTGACMSGAAHILSGNNNPA